MVLQVQTSWSIKTDAKLLFRKNYAKYEFFRTPAVSPDTSPSVVPSLGPGVWVLNLFLFCHVGMHVVACIDLCCVNTNIYFNNYL